MEKLTLRSLVLSCGLFLAGCSTGSAPSTMTTVPPPVPTTATETPAPSELPQPTDTMAPTPTSASGEIVVLAEADAFITDQHPERNYGDSLTLEVDNEPHSKNILLRFTRPEIPAGANLDQAILSLYVVDGSPSGGDIYEAGPWNESEVTWVNNPDMRDLITSVNPGADEGRWLHMDITDYVEAHPSLSFYILPGTGDGVDYASRESDTPPQLRIRWNYPNADTPTRPSFDDLGVVQGVMAGAGDIGQCDREGAESTASLIDNMEGVVFTVGDNAYPDGSETDYQECYDPTWGRLLDRTFPATGNHDYRTTDASGYFSYFEESGGTPDKGYYSYDLGSWHIIVLDSNCGHIGGCDSESEQGQWLLQDLADHPALCTMAMFHHPLMSSGGTHGGSNRVRPFWDMLYAQGAEVILNGHEHVYERFALLDAKGNFDPENGIRQFVVGTGGADLYNFAETISPASEAHYNDSHGVLKLILYETGYEWEFIPTEDHGFEDTGFGTCH